MKPARHVAMNIVNQILDLAGTDVAKRQAINDQCDDFVEKLVKEYALSAIGEDFPPTPEFSDRVTMSPEEIERWRRYAIIENHLKEGQRKFVKAEP